VHIVVDLGIPCPKEKKKRKEKRHSKFRKEGGQPKNSAKPWKVKKIGRVSKL
jgi:hypothetical protein